MRLSLCALIAVTSLCAAAPPSDARVRITGTFSNLTYNSEGGDLLGMEVLIVPAPGDRAGFVAFVQLAEGGAPRSALVPLKVDGAKVKFTLPKDGALPEMHFSGVVSKTELVGTWSHGGEREVLIRGVSYWDRTAL
jgi:hypothetical protein